MAHRLEKKHPLAIRWFHWINFPVLAVMVWSGALIYWANPVHHFGPWLLFDEKLFDKLGLSYKLALGMAWHFAAVWFFVVNGLAYVLYTACSGEWRHLVPGRGTLRQAWHVLLHDLRLRKEPPPPAKYNAAQQIAYSAIVVMGFLSLLTGLAIYKPVQVSWLTALFGGYGAARFFHFWLTVGYCVFFLVHLAQVARAGWNNFRAMLTGYALESDLGEAAVGSGAPDEPDGEDVPVKTRISRLSRRAFLWSAAAASSVYFGWRWLIAQPTGGERLPGPLRAMLNANAKLWSSLPGAGRLAPTFPRSRARMPRVNGRVGLSGAPLPSSIRIESGRRTVDVDVARIVAMRATEVVAEHFCIEGWSEVVRWTGAPLSQVLAEALGGAEWLIQSDGPTFRYLHAETPDRRYFVALEMEAVLHPQTLLCWAMDGKPLTEPHGAPLRLVVPTKYGIKSLKRIGRIRLTEKEPPDYWRERGYDGYAGL